MNQKNEEVENSKATNALFFMKVFVLGPVSCLGLISIVCFVVGLIGLFWYYEFYKLIIVSVVICICAMIAYHFIEKRIKWLICKEAERKAKVLREHGDLIQFKKTQNKKS